MSDRVDQCSKQENHVLGGRSMWVSEVNDGGAMGRGQEEGGRSPGRGARTPREAALCCLKRDLGASWWRYVANSRAATKMKRFTSGGELGV